jgi:hypothetical protein
MIGLTHFRWMHGCLRVPGPPNLGLSTQFLHDPQSSERKQLAHALHGCVLDAGFARGAGGAAGGGVGRPTGAAGGASGIAAGKHIIISASSNRAPLSGLAVIDTSPALLGGGVPGGVTSAAPGPRTRLPPRARLPAVHNAVPRRQWAVGSGQWARHGVGEGGRRVVRGRVPPPLASSSTP